ncbi:MAG: hypothetical protein AAGK97_00615 [Bacteroidota bacterium]
MVKKKPLDLSGSAYISLFKISSAHYRFVDNDANNANNNMMMRCEYIQRNARAAMAAGYDVSPIRPMLDMLAAR